MASTSKISEINIKLIHVFNDKFGYNVLFTTINDEVLSYGQNSNGSCGLGHNMVLKEPQIIQELCFKNITQFVSGLNFIVAKSADQKLYGWGKNDFGQLGQGIISSQDCYLKPLVIYSNIILNNISCGDNHCLVVTSKNILLSWGDNRYGQTGCESNDYCISKPNLLMNLQHTEICSIYCANNHSFAITMEGEVYSWGYNNWCQLGHEIDRNERIFEPKRINIINVNAISTSLLNTFFLTSEGIIYFCGHYYDEKNMEIYQKSPQILNENIKFDCYQFNILNYKNQSITSKSDLFLFYLIWNNCNNSNYKIFSDFCMSKFQLNYKRIEFKEDKFYSITLSDILLVENSMFTEEELVNKPEIQSQLEYKEMLTKAIRTEVIGPYNLEMLSHDSRINAFEKVKEKFSREKEDVFTKENLMITEKLNKLDMEFREDNTLKRKRNTIILAKIPEDLRYRFESRNRIKNVYIKESQKPNLNTFKTIEQCQPINLKVSGDFHWLFKTPFKKHSPPEPIQKIGPINTWDLFHVKMPNSTQNNDQIKKMIEMKDKDAYDFEFTWQIIVKSLSSEIKSISEFEDRVKNYNRKWRADKTEFNVIRHLDHTFDIRPPLLVTINFMRRLTLRLSEFFPKAIPLLKQSKNSTLVLSRQQIACLLANAFFCTFPRRSEMSTIYKTFSTFNFQSLFSAAEETVHVKAEKLKCIINYFNQITTNFDTMNGVISFERRMLTDSNRPNWLKSEKKLCKLKVELLGTIEMEGKGYSQVDFAANFIGANVLHSKCYREEILFLKHPELIVARLFTETLEKDESLIVTGCFQCNECVGYDRDFKWSADYKESLTLDDWGRAHRQFVLIDAYFFQYKERQYNMEMIDRELNKAFSGFYDLNEYKQIEKPAIASGKWGSGMCNGDPYLKLLIQLLAASEAERKLILYTFNDNYTKTEIEKFYSLMNEKGLTVGQIYNTMKNNPFPNSESKFDFNYLSFISTRI